MELQECERGRGLNASLSLLSHSLPQSKSLSAGDDQDKLLGEATKQVEMHAFEMKTCLVMGQLSDLFIAC